MFINKDLTLIRCELNRTNLDTSLMTMAEQSKILDDCLSTDIDFPLIRRTLDLAMQDQLFKGWLAELNNLIRKDEMLRGHDYLKMWFKFFFVLGMGANFVIADTATHNMLQNRLTYEQKNELLHMMRGRKHEPRGQVEVN